jgi:ATP-dependent helicase/nuclease subunit A
VRPVDADVRERVRTEHATSFVLVAGAGTGKTTLLIDRIEALVRSGAALLTEIAAVTFTENAATTLKLRLRERLERLRTDDRATEAEKGRALAALDVLEIAPIATIHALCALILSERPLECGVVPGFMVADEIRTDRLFAEAWEEWLSDRLVAGDPVLIEALARGLPLEAQNPAGERSSLRGFACRLVDQRDLAPLTGPAEVAIEEWRDEVVARTAGIGELMAGVTPDDLLASRLGELAAFGQRARFLTGEPLVAHLRAFPALRRVLGRKSHWPDVEALSAARRIAQWASEFPPRLSAAVGSAFHARLSQALLGVVDLYERKKTALGLLDFLDLLVKTRDALERRESVRNHFRARFRHLIIDEFQDTDPLQVEIAELLTGGRPGALVVVGDAKQSIYRFRRADAALLERVARQAEASPGSAVVHLTQSFRSRPAILRFVNQAFGRLMQHSAETDQPRYEPVTPPAGLLEGPAVIALSFEAPWAEQADLLFAEARAAAAMLSDIARGGLPVRDPTTGRERASRAGDVMVLPRRLTKIRALEQALENLGLGFIVEGGKSFFDRQEVHEVLALLRAIDDPSDTLSLVAALRSTFLSVSDHDLVAYALSGGRLGLGVNQDERPGAEALVPALDLVDRLHAARGRMSVASLLESLFDETRALAALSGSRRGRAQAANLEKVVTLARDAAALGVLTLRGFVDLLALRILEAAEEPDLPAVRAADPDTVRILTIHKAKGLEAPIVLLHDLADEFYSFLDVVPIRATRQVAIGFREGVQPPGWAEIKAREEARAWAEARRLQYVACTRGRDWLIVPKPGADARVGAFWRDLVGELPAAPTDDVRIVEAATLVRSSVDAHAEDVERARVRQDEDALALRWEQERRQRLEAGAYRPFVPVAVTRASRETTPPRATHPDGDRARAFGRLVHRLLEWMPLDSPIERELEATARALAPGLGLGPGSADEAAAHVRRALAHPVVVRASRARHYRELPVWLPEEGRLLEGVVDLVFEEPEGLVLVDYKTDAIGDEQALDQAARHAAQLRIYARALSLAWGQPAKERLVLFTALGRAVRV